MSPACRPDLDEITCTTKERMSKLDLDLLLRRSQWPRVQRVCGLSHIGNAVSNSVCLFGCCLLSGRGLCDRPITRPDEIY